MEITVSEFGDCVIKGVLSLADLSVECTVRDYFHIRSIPCLKITQKTTQNETVKGTKCQLINYNILTSRSYSITDIKL